MVERVQKYYTPEEYLALEAKAEYKSEYYNGRIFRMAGGSNRHNQIVSNVNAALNVALLDTPCITYSSDMRILVQANGLYTYADVSGVCAEPEFASRRNDTILNPTLIVEVLSPSTAGYDRGDKFNFYRALPSLQVYILVYQSSMKVECYQKGNEDSWNLTTYTEADQVIKLTTLGIELSLSRFYSKVQLPAKPVRQERKRRLPHPEALD